MEYSEMMATLVERGGNPHYSKRYINFIANCDAKNNHKDGDYVEKHHILPKSKGYWPEYRLKSKFPWNTVELTAEQHFLAHWILARAIGGRMWFAFNMMFVCSTNGDRIKYSSKKDRKLYGDLKKNMREQLRSKAAGKKLTPEQKEVLRAACTGRKKSSEELDKLSKSLRKTKRKLYQHKTFIKMYSKEYSIYVPKYDENIQFQRLAEGWQFKCTPECRSKIAIETNRGRAEYKTKIKRVYYGQFYCLCKEGTKDYDDLIAIGGKLKMTPEYAERIRKENSEKRRGKKPRPRRGLGVGEFYLVWDKTGVKKYIPIDDPVPLGYTVAYPFGKKKYWFVNIDTKRMDYLNEYEAEVGGYIKTHSPNGNRIKYKHDSGRNLYLNIDQWPYSWLPVNIKRV